MGDAEHKPAEPTLLQRRTIEAEIVGPLIRGFEADLGRERTLQIVRNVIVELARTRGEELARELGTASLTAFAACVGQWHAGGALEIELLEANEEQLAFNVTRCRYAEMYQSLGLADLGYSLSCQRDGALAKGFNPGITLTRTHTLMNGDSHCDFRFQTSTADTSGDEGSTNGSASST